ncbi:MULTISPECIES: twin-arginine translocation signal domain-containing protein [Mesorhizobium]|uniref:twin-arginine translocation signal domain-containing protein n=1 Tax=Mesorhizobium TaxID=68287 RepID=UPI0012EB9A94|nr:MULTISPECIES: twin-arginine translocation signal domain-containing protein [Mesorhizobium]WJI40610.1 twin-arginine translocation signal domain-containing protein [Mesorhizobium opportunistum]
MYSTGPIISRREALQATAAAVALAALPLQSAAATSSPAGVSSDIFSQSALSFRKTGLSFPPTFSSTCSRRGGKL